MYRKSHRVSSLPLMPLWLGHLINKLEIVEAAIERGPSHLSNLSLLMRMETF